MSPPAALDALWASLAPVRARLADADDAVVTRQVALCEIPAPTGAEDERGAAVARCFREFGLAEISTDDVGNVTAVRPGETSDAPVVVCAHLDTIFPADTAVAVRREGDRLLAPGIVDNARGLATTLALAEAFDGARVRTRRPILFAATVGEEGAGDLRGMKHLMSHLSERPHACIILDGAGDDRIITRALGARRLRVTFRAEGGHSWSAFGVPNPVHAAGSAAAKLAKLPLPRKPRTTLSVCRIGGGVSINAIPDDAWLEIDIRSTSADTIASCVRDVEHAVVTAAREENARRASRFDPMTFHITIVGDRPSGSVDAQHPLVKAAERATQLIGSTPEFVTSSTDANVPLSLGIPAVAIGAGGLGGNTHTANEWYENTNGHLGIARALTLLAAMAEVAAVS